MLFSSIHLCPDTVYLVTLLWRLAGMLFVNYFNWPLLYHLFFVIDLHMIEISNLQLQIYICKFPINTEILPEIFLLINSKLISFPSPSDDVASLAGCFFVNFHIPSMLSIILLKLLLIYPFTFIFFPTATQTI